MKKILCLFLCLWTTSLWSQTITKIIHADFEVEGEDIIISYEITNARKGQTFDIAVYLSTDGGIYYDPNPLQAITKETCKNNSNRQCWRWKVLEEFQSLESETVCFKIKATYSVVVPSHVKKDEKNNQPKAYHTPPKKPMS